MRSSVEWINREASCGSIAFIGKKPYATVPNASRTQWLSVNPATQTGRTVASGSTFATKLSIASQSGVQSSLRVPPRPSIHSRS